MLAFLGPEASQHRIQQAVVTFERLMRDEI